MIATEGASEGRQRLGVVASSFILLVFAWLEAFRRAAEIRGARARHLGNRTVSSATGEFASEGDVAL